MNRAKISIALATCNGSVYLRDQLGSYITQERLPDEVVVCDDVSTDYTFDILDQFKQIAPFQVKIIKNQRRLGFIKNFERVLTNCSGDLILLSDQDDIWFPIKIGTIEDSFQKKPDKYLVVHDGELVDENLVSYGATKLGQIMAGYGTDDSFVTGALTAFRKELIPYVLPIPDGIPGHDVWLHNIASIMGKRFVLAKNLQQIRRHSTNTSSWVANTLVPISKITVFGNQLSLKPATSYCDRQLYNPYLRERLHEINLFDRSAITAHTIQVALEHLRSERKAISNRESLINRRFFGKKIMALKMLIHGDYTYFNGIKSFMRDFIR
ncbi:MAG: glycosyltransferase [Candidatus Electrothrix sp. AR4]|nr:glycosyltransferase [Candidatus Electrothrix sp. AR4]